MTLLKQTSDGLVLCAPDHKMTPLIINFGSSQLQWRQKTSGKKQALARAVGIKKDYYPSILDCTAGLGRDAFILANLGCKVVMLERHEALYALLKDGLARAKDDERLIDTSQRLHLIQADALLWLRNTQQQFDTIYCDPMFPENNKSALVKKDMQILQQVVGNDIDADQLLSVALTKAQRVVVKRHRHAPWLAQQKPNVELKGKTVRYDIYTQYNP